MKKILVLFVFLAAMGVMIDKTVWADDFEWYTLKDEISGAINFRSEPSLNSKILDYAIIQFCYVVPLFKIVEKRSDGWYRAKSNREGFARNTDYQYKYFWVAGCLLRKVDLQKEKLAVLVPADYDYSTGISVHEKPHVFSQPEWKAVPNDWQYIYASVKTTGKQTGPFIEIIQLDCFGKGNKEFVLAEYFGIKKQSRYLKFPVPKKFYTRSRYLNGDFYSGTLRTRKEPSILSRDAGDYARGGMPVKVIGEQGFFYKTSKEKWILKQCLVNSR